jgi:hypothetical protein
VKLDKNKLAITVESELCAGGEEVAKALAGMLKLKCLSDEITGTAAKLSGISRKLLRRYEAKRVRQAYDLSAESEDELHIPAEKYFLAAQVAACRTLADEGPCVLVDHHSNAALADRENHVGIFIHADREDRLNTYARLHWQTPFRARRSFNREDRERTGCFRTLSRNWGKASNYCLTVNSSCATTETLAQNIVRYLETVTQEELVHPTSAQERSA